MTRDKQGLILQKSELFCETTVKRNLLAAYPPPPSILEIGCLILEERTRCVHGHLLWARLHLVPGGQVALTTPLVQTGRKQAGLSS